MKKFLNKYLPGYIRFLLLTYVLVIILYTLFRLFFLFQVYEHFSEIPFLSGYLIDSFLIGLHFDTVIICYILSVPFIILSFLSFFNYKNRLLFRFIGLYLSILFILSFFIIAVDIPWFNYNLSRLNVAVLNWIETPDQMVGIAFSNTIYIYYFLGFIILSILFYFVISLIRRRTVSAEKNQIDKNISFRILLNLSYFIIFSSLLFLGLRGNIKAPLKQVDACVSNNPVLNQLGLNPIFTFVKSFSNKLNVIDDQTAIDNVRKYFNIDTTIDFDSPVARIIQGDSAENHLNVVLVIMESMTANNLSRFGNTENLTPNIDSLAKNGLSFDNIWSAGKHTSNGIFSTLYSYPGIWSQPPTSNIERAVFSGFPFEFKQRGYKTLYFTTHDLSYDNLKEFLFPNGFEKAIEVNSYPKEKIVGMYGVPDHVMFERVINEISSLSEKHQKCFTTIMTTSNHAPYVIPEGISFKPRSEMISKIAVEYSDWAIGYFMQMASKEPWFDSTVFIFTADHGANVGKSKFEIPLSFHHIPFIIFNSELMKHSDSSKKLGGQIDIFPTVMSYLNFSYVNNTFGVDLFKEQRPYIYFTEDDKMACLNDTTLYVYFKDKTEHLLMLNGEEEGNVMDKYYKKAQEHKKYMFSMLQTAQWMIERKKTGYISCPK